MDAQDRNSNGWQVWLTPRQTRIIHDALTGYECEDESEHVERLVEWFGHEAEVQAKRVTE